MCSSRTAPRRIGDAARRRRHALALALVCAAALGTAAAQWSASASFARMRWVALAHDRNVHYLDAIELAIDARAGDAASLLHELDRSRQWPPLEPLLGAAAMLAGGIDPRVATLPSLASWVALVVLAALTAAASAPGASLLAGAVGALLALGSPAHRAFATDVMLESLGAALTLGALAAWTRARSGGGLAAWRWLAAAATLLFFTKYNYWLLLVAALAVAETARSGRAAFGAARRVARDAVPWIARQLRRPFVWIVPAALAWAAVMPRLGRLHADVLGVPIEVRSAAEPLQVAFVAAVLACVPWLRRSGRAWLAALDPRARALGLGHALPLGLYFLLPTRLGRLIAYVGPGNAAEPWAGVAAGAQRYAAWVAADDFASLASAALALVLAAASLPALRRRVPGVLGAASLFAVGAALAVLHPNQQPRFAHTWVPGLWVLAGAGAAAIATAIRSAPSRAAFAGLVLGAFGASALSAPLAGRSGDAGHHDLGASVRDVTDAALDLAGGAQRLAFVASAPFDKTAKWSAFERRPARAAFAGAFAPEADAAAARARFDRWIAGLDADAVVLIEGIEHPPFTDSAPSPSWSALGDWMRTQQRFEMTDARALSRYGVEVSVWREPARAR